MLAFLPWPILMGATMRRRERLGVAIAMSLGAIAGACGIIKAWLVPRMTSTDITYDRVDLTIWTLTEPAASIMAVSIPVLSVYPALFSISSGRTNPNIRRMLYRELKSSARSYGRSKSQTNAPERTKRYGQGTHYGRNSVVVMSTAGWQESQEALKDAESGQVTPRGIMKTEEVRVRHETAPPVDPADRRNSIEMLNLRP